MLPRWETSVLFVLVPDDLRPMVKPFLTCSRRITTLFRFVVHLVTSRQIQISGTSSQSLCALCPSICHPCLFFLFKISETFLSSDSFFRADSAMAPIIWKPNRILVRILRDKPTNPQRAPSVCEGPLKCCRLHPVFCGRV